jgi:hypothetical protein
MSFMFSLARRSLDKGGYFSLLHFVISSWCLDTTPVSLTDFPKLPVVKCLC